MISLLAWTDDSNNPFQQNTSNYETTSEPPAKVYEIPIHKGYYKSERFIVWHCMKYSSKDHVVRYLKIGQF